MMRNDDRPVAINQMLFVFTFVALPLAAPVWAFSVLLCATIFVPGLMPQLSGRKPLRAPIVGVLARFREGFGEGV
eukprot:CAMPEP_0170182504 /NCGR_PEP_ID=MMETSP0040_2-20121228/28076_1 /TAXON_ID=641309 /ORGANISM="Lotharella oceanica, Strain CCMP622" /LENGTH=74 /DNA_ID=CAMNT_0010427939 /DNA_START=856 /DNA_END=1080 /DNA_ORIENTATION=-